jgi:hypothetical protein
MYKVRRFHHVLPWPVFHHLPVKRQAVACFHRIQAKEGFTVNTQVMVVGSAKGTYRRRPRIRLAGFWLNGIGFEPDSLVIAGYDTGSIVFKSQGKGIGTYKKLVRQVRENRSGLLQVKQEMHNKKRTPHLEVKGLWLEDLGFAAGSVIVVLSEYGVIRIRLLDLGKLGF